MGRPVTQDWVHDLSFMQQSVLITSCRGPDGLRKDHVSKLLIRWMRRCFMIFAFKGTVLGNPYDPDGGSFTGPSMEMPALSEDWRFRMDEVVTEYLRHVDEMPHHFQLHFMHAAEILGYKHPDDRIRKWWNKTYRRLANDMHLPFETEMAMNQRLGDNEGAWRRSEEVTAKGP